MPGLSKAKKHKTSTGPYADTPANNVECRNGHFLHATHETARKELRRNGRVCRQAQRLVGRGGMHKKGADWCESRKKMLKHQWQIFGLPHVITSDQGSHFVSSWFEALAAGLGIRQAFSQAYHHQANGRAEMAGQQLMEKLRKMNADEGVNWVECLPAALKHIHDTPGVSGLSPYQILFGRERNLPNLPYEAPRDCEDAQAFLSRMGEIDAKVAQALNETHERRAHSENAKRPEAEIFKTGQRVWYRRPEGSGDKLDSRWLGPALVLCRVAENSYEIQITEDRTIRAHTSFMKPYVTDAFVGQPKPLFFHQRTVPDPDATPDEWNVHRILDFRGEGATLEYLVHWEGYGAEEAVWEPIGHFFQRFNCEAIRFAKEKGIPLDVTKFLPDSPTGEQ